MPLDDLPALLDRLDSTGCIYTSIHDGRMDAAFATYVLGSSIETPPRRFVIMTSHENLTHELVEASGLIAVHPVALGQEQWVERFGLVSGRDVDKLAGVRWRPGLTGVPILEDALGYVEGRVLDSMDRGDHSARLVEALDARLPNAGAIPLRCSDAVRAGIVDARDPERFPRW